MNAVVTPVDIQAQVDDTENVDARSPPVPDTDDKPSAETVVVVDEEQAKATLPVEPTTEPASPEQVEVARKKRLAAFIEKWVPNKEIWPHLLELQPPRNVFDRDELPFQERTFICSSNTKGLMEFWESVADSIMLPYYGVMASVAVSTFSAFAALIEQFNDDTTLEYPSLTIIATVGPLVLGLTVMFLLHEYPSRVFLYHRLWEQKIIIDFKKRTWKHPFTATKLIFLAAWLGFYYWYGKAEFNEDVTVKSKSKDGLSFYLTVAQSVGTIAWAIYSNLAVDKTLIPVNSAFHHARTVAKLKEKQQLTSVDNEKKPTPASSPSVEASAPIAAEKSTVEGSERPATIAMASASDASVVVPSRATSAVAARAVERLAVSFSQIQVVSETALRYDICALNTYLLEATKRSKQSASEANIKQQIDEEKEWLKTVAMWVGRLGHSKETMTRTIRIHEKETYAMGFVGDKNLYDDELWHNSGSFSKTLNRSGFSAKSLVMSTTVAEFLIVLIEVYVLKESV